MAPRAISALFAAVALAAWSGGEMFLAAMGAIGCLMTLWVGGLTQSQGDCQRSFSADGDIKRNGPPPSPLRTNERAGSSDLALFAHCGGEP